MQSARDDDRKQRKWGSYWQMDSRAWWEIRETGATNGRYRKSNQKLGQEKINRREKTKKTKIREKNSRRKTNRGDETGASNVGKKGKDNNKDPKGKLLKLVISQFSVHTYRFWNQFETQIDKSELSSVVHNLGVLAHFSSWGTFEIESKIRQEKIVKIHKGFEW